MDNKYKTGVGLAELVGTSDLGRSSGHFTEADVVFMATYWKLFEQVFCANWTEEENCYYMFDHGLFTISK